MPCDTTLVFEIYTAREALPVPGARITITDPETGATRVLIGDSSGRTEPICVSAPPAERSLSPGSALPVYKRYTARIEAEGYYTEIREDIRVFAGVQALQPVEMEPSGSTQSPQEAEGRSRTAMAAADLTGPDPVEPADSAGGPNYTRTAEPRGYSGELFFPQQVYIPRYITVHLGTPNDSAARNVTVSFIDYIKNVASSEIYPTWPVAALRANIITQITFALNRIFTEWYPSQGYNFDITNNTNYDQYYVYGRNIYTNISNIVDEIFNQYIRRRGTLNPIFAQYCNGTTVTCQGLSQWGTVALATNGYTPINILRYYYGDDIEVVTANDIRAITSSYPGTPLRQGSVGTAVGTMESRLNRIRLNYPSIPAISTVDGRFTAETTAAVRAFQRTFNLTPDGIVGRATWNRISYIFTAVTGLGQLNSEGIPLPPQPPESVLRLGSTGEDVRTAQYLLSVIGQYYQAVSPTRIDGIFGSGTQQQVLNFQRLAGLSADGVIGRQTWNELFSFFNDIAATSGIGVAYPGTLLRVGSRGQNVLLMQEYLNRIADSYPLPSITADGIFGNATRNAVIAFQRLFGLDADGIIGQMTWNRIVAVRLLLR